jgi:hypothetical protein
LSVPGLSKTSGSPDERGEAARPPEAIETSPRYRFAHPTYLLLDKLIDELAKGKMMEKKVRGERRQKIARRVVARMSEAISGSSRALLLAIPHFAPLMTANARGRPASSAATPYQSSSLSQRGDDTAM